MAEVVAAAGVPHTPVFPSLAAGDTEAGADIAARYAAVASVLDEADADLVVVLTCDHINTYFLDAWPTFAVMATDTVIGPNDEVPGVAPAEFTGAGKAGSLLHESLLRQNFDPVLSRGGTVDHSVIVPTHFLNRHRVPVLPVYVNGMVSPMPSARRCHDFGRALADAIADLPVRRVAVIASGSFSLEVGGPRMDPERLYGVPDAGWAGRAAEHLRDGDLDRLVSGATPEQIAGAGTVAGEILPWITAAALCRDLPLARIDHRPGEGHAFAAWGGAR
ncbi:hypothetical protein [Lentzea sp. CA-135723]|uniref:DODA-type extradiol aromatic ring-opening family dioxygenase n=1 Tax=Lentzea sp. CA-135723 TaxID=3239950 RepID=UPI003D942D64